ncbi:hypothetical protein J2Z53_000812 [Clostridium moniliforme]|uniref:DUF2922 domain-containing protein n=1 Tax=Clostridium moniliforme TaxID=39489 RepID=A0ABS4EZ15_9CLOT|nr:DUF2922 domain-containing protein [Clostridium moniliforme]MBP1889231.1 hypothetical protein [Clostridium moniliforme]
MLEKSLVIGFENDLGKKSNITIKDIKDDVNNTTVNSLMDLIISSDIFVTSGGSLVKKVSAAIISKEVTEIELV